MADATPMMAQYRRLKSRNPQAILFFRLGDFYEMFEEDARTGSRVLDLTLTQRNGVPMCGVPYHAAAVYTNRLLKAGHKVAMCEQTPGQNRELMEREVVEVITPGTVLDPGVLAEGRNNYLLCLGQTGPRIGAAWVDLSTGQLAATGWPAESAGEPIRAEFLRLSPSEVLIQETLLERNQTLTRILSERKGIAVNRLPDWAFDPATNAQRVKQQIGVTTLTALGFVDTDPEVACAGALLEYLGETSRTLLPHIREVRRVSDKQRVTLGESTQRNLELVQNLSDGGGRYTLYEVLNATRTAMGARLLREWVLSPLTDRGAIERRLGVVEWLYRGQLVLSRLRESLTGVYDLERLASRIALDKAHAKDLLAVAASLDAARGAAEVLTDPGASGGAAGPANDIGAALTEATAKLEEARTLVQRAITEEPSLLLTEGNLIRRGYDAELDRLSDLRTNARGILEELLERERRETGIPSLKLRYNRVIGHFLEVTKSHLERVPPHFQRRQSMAGAERFTTEGLLKIETELVDAEERMVELERTLFLDLRRRLREVLPLIQGLAAEVATLDVLASFAYNAAARGYTRPILRDDTVLSIREGRHPVVEAYLEGRAFVPNSLDLDPRGVSFVMLTGPNMAGKSTFLRQTALIVLMAQIGSFVPAAEAVVGLVDAIFCRVGASDNLARGESTFLVEMSETAHILRSATRSSLLVFDEVGRGTSTREGQAIAWAVTGHVLTRIRARTLFATHFHELTRFEHPALVNQCMDVAEEGGKVVFLKRIRAGVADQSYGIHVARIAGVPEEVIRVAEEVLRTTAPTPALTPPADREPESQQLLFPAGDLVLNEIRSLTVDETTPLEALGVIAKWKRDLGGSR